MNIATYPEDGIVRQILTEVERAGGKLFVTRIELSKDEYAQMVAEIDPEESPDDVFLPSMMGVPIYVDGESVADKRDNFMKEKMQEIGLLPPDPEKKQAKILSLVKDVENET